MTLPPYPFGLVRWMDAHSPAATDAYSATDIDSLHRPYPIITMGWILRDDADGVTIGGEWVGGQEFRNLTIVQRVLVVETVRLKLPRPPRAKRPAPSPGGAPPPSTETP